MNKSKLMLIFCLFTFQSQLFIYSQIPSANLLLSNIKKKIYQPPNYKDVYFDLNKGSIIYLNNAWYNGTVEKEVGFTDTVFQGSFLNRGAKEYLLNITWNNSDLFPHVDNFGPINQFIFFDSSFNQISRIYFQSACSELKEIVDIDEDGVNEIILNEWYCGMGTCAYGTEIYYKNLDTAILSYCSEMEFYMPKETGYSDEMTKEGVSDYIIEKEKFTVKITKYNYLRVSYKDVRFINEEQCQCIYSYSKGKFQLLSGKDCELEGY
jgi:hypothetical protein